LNEFYLTSRASSVTKQNFPENEALSNLEVSTEQPPSTDIISRTISSSSLLTTVDQLQNIDMPITSAASSYKNTSSDVPSPIEKATSFLTNSLIKAMTIFF